MENNQKEESKNLKEEIKKRTVGYLTAAFGLVAGLAWNDAIKSLIEYLFPLEQNTLLVKFSYAILLTIIVVVVTMNLIKVVEKK